MSHEQHHQHVLDAKNKEDEAMHNATIGAIKGGVIGIVAGSLSTWGLNTKSALFRGLTVPGKVFFLSSFVVAGFYIGGEKALLSTVRAPTHIEVPTNEVKEEVVNEPTVLGIPRSTMIKYKYHVVAGAWATSMVGYLAYTNTQQHMKFSQKLIQGRVYAQFITISAMLAAAYLTQVGVEKKPKRANL